MSNSINLQDTKRQAFIRGFWKGMAAPLMLFSAAEMPAEARVTMQQLPVRERRQESDWVRVGNALRKAAQDHREQGQ